MSAIIVGIAVFVIILIIILVIFLSKKDTPAEKLPKLSSKRVVFEDEEQTEEEKKYYLPEIKPIIVKPIQKRPRPVIDNTQAVPFSLSRQTVKLKDTNLCIDAIEKGWLANNQPIILYPCHGKRNQQLSTSEVGLMFFSFPPKCMSVSPSVNQAVKQNPCDDMALETQWWEYDSKERIRLSNNPSLCLGVSNIQPGTNLQIQTCSDSNNQKWVVN